MSTQSKKFDLSVTAVTIFEEAETIPTVSDMCYPNDISVLDYYDLFSTRLNAFRYYFETIPFQYLEMTSELDGYQELEPGEKLTNFVLSSIDQLDNSPKSTKHYFDNHLELQSALTDNAAHVISEILKQDQHIPSVNHLFLNKASFKILAVAYISLLRYAVESDNPSRQRTFALTEKLSAFFNELITNATFSTGIDVVRFMLQQNIISIPFVSAAVSSYLNKKDHE